MRGYFDLSHFVHTYFESINPHLNKNNLDDNIEKIVDVSEYC
jgi:hypothetical protein